MTTVAPTNTVTATNGAATPEAGALDGLAGLFAALLGGTPGDGVTDDVLALPPSVAEAVQPGQQVVRMITSTVVVQQTIEVTQGVRVQVQATGPGASDAVSAFQATLQDLLAQLQQLAGLSVAQLGQLVQSDDKTNELAAALTKLGMPADQAAGVAASIETMLKLLNDQQQQVLDDQTQGGLVATLLAALLPQQPVGNVLPVNTGNTTSVLQVQTTSVTTVQLRVVYTPKKMVNYGLPQQTEGGAGLARTLAGLQAAAGETAAALPLPLPRQGATIGLDLTTDVTSGAAVPPAPVVTVALPPIPAAAVTTPAEAATPALLTAVAPQLPPAKVTPPVTQPVATGVAAAVMAADASPVVAPATLSMGAEVQAARIADAARQPADLNKVTSPREPRGVTVYVWKADKHGAESLQLLTPVPVGGEAGVNTGTPLSVGNTQGGESPATTATHGSFGSQLAHQVALAQRAQVTAQVALQFKPLTENGGGTVRMTLNPPELGQLEIELRIKDNKVHGVIAASSAAVVEQLARDMQQFRQSLADAGLNVGQEGISLMLSQHGQEQGGQGDGRGAPGGNQPGLGAWADEAAPVTSPATWVAPERVLDLRV